MVLSCYYPLRGSWWDGINTTSERGQMFVNDACTEILAGKFGAQKYCHELSFNTETTDVTYFYYTRDEPYGFIGKISRCTTVMNMIEKSELSREEKDRYIAEDTLCSWLSVIHFVRYVRSAGNCTGRSS